MTRDHKHEHGVLLGLGLVIGTLAAGLALLPALRTARSVPILPSLAFLLAITLSGVFWVWVASTLATRGRTIDGLRSD